MLTSDNFQIYVNTNSKLYIHIYASSYHDVDYFPHMKYANVETSKKVRIYIYIYICMYFPTGLRFICISYEKNNLHHITSQHRIDLHLIL
jgi:hypothetical protein